MKLNFALIKSWKENREVSYNRTNKIHRSTLLFAIDRPMRSRYASTGEKFKLVTLGKQFLFTKKYIHDLRLKIISYDKVD